MTERDMKRYADQPEMMALIQAVRAHDYQTAIMTGVIKAAPERTREQWFRCAAELIEELTDQLRREDIHELLRSVESGEVEMLPSENESS